MPRSKVKSWSRDEVLEMHRHYIEDDVSYRDLAHQYELSHEGVRQLFKEYGLNTDKPRRSAQLKLNQETEAYERRVEIVAAYKNLGNLESTARLIGLPVKYIKPHISEDDRLFYRNQGSAPAYTKDQIADFLRHAARICGEPLTLPKYVAIAPEMGLPAQSTIVRPFNGMWQEACEYAGVRFNPPRGKRADTISQEDCIRALKQCHFILNRVPSYNVYDRWAKENGKPSGGTVRSKFRLWRNALKAAFPELYE